MKTQPATRVRAASHVGALEGELQVLRGHGVGQRQCSFDSGRGHQRERCLCDARALRDQLLHQLGDPLEQREVRGSDDQEAVLAVFTLRADVKRDPAGFAVPSATTINSLGPAIPSIPTADDRSRLASCT